MSQGTSMRRLQDHLLLPVAEDINGRRSNLVYADVEYVRMVPYAKSHLHMALYILMVICTGGILLIVSVWFPQVFTRLARMRLPHSCLSEAHYMLILVQKDGMQSKWVECRVERIVSKGKPSWIWFEFRKHRYVFNQVKGEYERYLSTIQEELEIIHQRKNTGLSTLQMMYRKSIFGPNLVDIDQPWISMLFFTKIVHPYYLFQVFSAVIWFNQSYTLYAIVILVLSAISMTWEVFSEVSNGNRLRAMVASNLQVSVLRTSEEVGEPIQAIKIHEQDLVPGDIVELDIGPVCADILLLNGGCVVDEASLTGEAIPINKEAARVSKNEITVESARKDFKTSFLHAGSTITRLRDVSDGKLKGVVLSTGFSTGKGELFRSIIFPRHITFEFERDSYRYLLVLALVAIAAFIKRLTDFAKEGYSFGYTIVNSLDLITITVPPALPLVLSSGIGFALRRLQVQGIFCIDSKRVNSCGQLTCFCFDKTGTLTEESLTLVGMDVVEQGGLQRVSEMQQLPHEIRDAMTVCHSLSRVNGELQGYPLELSMFEAVNDGLLEGVALDCGTLNSFKKDTYQVHQRFPFDAVYQRSSAIAQVPGKHSTDPSVTAIFVKGSIEAVQRLCTSVPRDLSIKAQQYASQGHYCIAFGMRLVSPQEIATARDVVETNLTFLGLALFQNELKPDSKQVLKELYDAHVDVRMITGDHALTAVHVAQELDMKMEKSQIAVVELDESTGDVHYHIVQRRPRVVNMAPSAPLLITPPVMETNLKSLDNVASTSLDTEQASSVTSLDTEQASSVVCEKPAVEEILPPIKPETIMFEQPTVGETVPPIKHETIFNEAPVEIHWERLDASNLSRILVENEVAITGAALDHLQTEVSQESLKQLVLQTRVYARIRPQQKAWIIERLSDYGHIVGMCGDGTNDCGALKAAHVGLALSSAEASIVAPFTSKQKAVKDVPALIREGRCALTTSFLGFKFMVLYPIIQLGMASTLGHFRTMLSNNQYMWDDLGIVLGLSITMLLTGSSTSLSREKPPHTLFSRPIVMSILGQIALFIAFFAGMLAILNTESWFCSRQDGIELAQAFMDNPLNMTMDFNDPTKFEKCVFYTEYATSEFVSASIDDIPVSYEDSTIWLFAHMMYYSVAAAFNIKDPFRQPFYTNKLFTLLFLGSLGTSLWFLLDTSNIIGDSFQTLPLHGAFRIKMLLMFLGHIVAALVWEYFATRIVTRWIMSRDDRAHQERKVKKELHEHYHRQASVTFGRQNVDSQV